MTFKATYNDAPSVLYVLTRGHSEAISRPREFKPNHSLGGEYNIKLSDGSMVWMNAGSTLKFPSNFSSLKQRKVYLGGEAYFEVSKDTLHPFIIKK